MSASVYVGLDIGTTSIKVAAVTKQLETVFEKQYAYDTLSLRKAGRRLNQIHGANS